MNTPFRRALLFVGIFATLLGMGLVKIHKRQRIIQVSYKLTQARQQMTKLQNELRRLRLEESVLTNPKRIESLAKSMGMLRPSPHQVRSVMAHN